MSRVTVDADECLVHKAALEMTRTNANQTAAREELLCRRRRGSRLARGD